MAHGSSRAWVDRSSRSDGARAAFGRRSDATRARGTSAHHGSSGALGSAVDGRERATASSTATRASTMRWRCSTPAARRRRSCSAVTCVPGNVGARRRRPQHARGPRARRAGASRGRARPRPTARAAARASRPRRTARTGLGYAVPDAAALAPSDRPCRRPHRRGHARAAGRGHARHARAAHEPRARAPARPRAAAARARLVMMVGAYRTAGNTAPTTEWNAAVDPEALAIVLDGLGHARRPLAARGASGRARPRRHRAREDDAASTSSGSPRAAGDADGRLVRFVRDALRFYFEFHSRYDGFYGAFIHDALAVAVALDPSLGRSEALDGRGRARGAAHGRRDRRRLAARLGPRAERRHRRRGRHRAFFERFIERVGELAAARGLSRGEPRPGCASAAAAGHARRRRRSSGSRCSLAVGGPERCGSRALVARRRGAGGDRRVRARRAPSDRPPRLDRATVRHAHARAHARRDRDQHRRSGRPSRSALKVPLYLDSVGTILVAALAGPLAGAVTGLLSHLVWTLRSRRRRSGARTPLRSRSSRRHRAAGRDVRAPGAGCDHVPATPTRQLVVGAAVAVGAIVAHGRTSPCEAGRRSAR